MSAFRLRWLRSLWSFWRWVWWAVGARRLWGPRQVRDGVWWQGAGATHGLHEGTAVLCQRARRSQGKLTSHWVCNSAFITHTHSIQMDHSHRFTCFRLTYLLWSYSKKRTNVRYVVRMIFLLHSQQHQNNFISMWNEIGGIFCCWKCQMLLSTLRFYVPPNTQSFWTIGWMAGTASSPKRRFTNPNNFCYRTVRRGGAWPDSSVKRS